MLKGLQEERIRQAFFAMDPKGTGRITGEQFKKVPSLINTLSHNDSHTVPSTFFVFFLFFFFCCVSGDDEGP